MIAERSVEDCHHADDSQAIQFLFSFPQTIHCCAGGERMKNMLLGDDSRSFLVNNTRGHTHAVSCHVVPLPNRFKGVSHPMQSLTRRTNVSPVNGCKVTSASSF